MSEGDRADRTVSTMSKGHRTDRADSAISGDLRRGADDIQVLPAGLVRLSDPSVGATGPDEPSTVARTIAHRGRVNQAGRSPFHFGIGKQTRRRRIRDFGTARHRWGGLSARCRLAGGR